MKGFYQLGSIEYKLYPNDRTYLKKELCHIFRRGYILIGMDCGEMFRLFAIARTDFEHPNEIIGDIKKIPFPSLDDEYVYHCCISGPVTDDKLQKIKKVIDGLNNRDPSSYNTVVLDKSTKNNNYYMVTTVPKARKDIGHKTYGAGNYRPVIYGSNLDDLLNEICGTSGDSPLISQIKDWLGSTSYKDFTKAIESVVRGQPEVQVVTYVFYNYLECIAKGKPIDRQNIILAGPSGCGKTETYRAIKAYLADKIPLLVVDFVDTNQITSEGFVGKNTNFVVEGLRRGGSNGTGIVFLDEFDKRLIPEHSGQGDNVNRSVQNQLLLAIEGYMLDGIDTSKTLFVGMGSFNEIRERRGFEKHFGFTSDRNDKTVDHFDKITKEDIIELGASYELIGRFSQVVNYGPLPYDAIENIIDMRANEISSTIDTEVIVADSMRALIHENSNTEFGNRLIKSFLQEAVTRARIEALMNNLAIEAIVVTGRDRYKLIRAGHER